MSDVTIAKSRGRRLRSPANVRALIAHVLREVEASNMPVAEKSRILLFGSQTLLKAIEAEGSGWEARIKQAEAAVQRVRGDLRDYYAFKQTPEYKAWLSARSVHDDDADQVDPDVMKRHTAYHEAARIERQAAEDKEQGEQHVSSLARQLGDEDRS